MALIKQKEAHNTGAMGEYWRILETNISYESKLSRISLGLYKNKQARLDGKAPLDYQYFNWDGENFPFTVEELNNSNPIAISYERIKESKLDEEDNETNFFADAIDD
jgi:hypothetical protein